MNGYKVEKLSQCAIDALNETAERWRIVRAKNSMEYKEWERRYMTAVERDDAANQKLADMCELVGADYNAVIAIAKSCIRHQMRTDWNSRAGFTFTSDEADAYRRAVEQHDKPCYRCSGREWDSIYIAYDGVPVLWYLAEQNWRRCL